MSLIDLLTESRVDEFNAQRAAQRTPPDLFAADLPDKKLAEADLAGANLQKSDLSGTDLTGAMLARADLSEADLTGAVLRGAMALRSKWREAYLGEADLSDADLSGSDLSGAELTEAKASNIVLNGAKLKGAMLDKAVLDGADFTEARLGGANLAGADLRNAIFKEASLAGADLTGANLNGADLTRAKLNGANLTDADLSGAKLVSADLTGADLSGAKLDGTDLRRADLTNTILVGADIDAANVTDAQLDPHLVASKGLKAEKVPLLVEDASFAINGKSIAALWENSEGDAGGRLRVATGKLDRAFDGKSVALPVPADLVLARGITAHQDGFAAVALVERPGGTMITVVTFDDRGKASPGPTIKLPYAAAVRPLLRSENGELRLYGIGRDGPALLVHRIGEEGLEVLHLSRMATARGFVGNVDPVVLSKGGVVVLLGEKGAGQPMRAPSSFPGRACAACAIDGGGVALAWAVPREKGLHVALLRPGENPEEHKLLPKAEIGTVDIAPGPDGTAWVLFTAEGETPGAPAEAQAVLMPNGTPFPVSADPDVDVSDLRLVRADGIVLAALTTLDEQVVVSALSAKGAKERWRIG